MFCLGQDNLNLPIVVIYRATGHIEDEIESPAMQIPDLTDVKDDSLKDPVFIKALENILMSWEIHITKVIDDCLKKVSEFLISELNEFTVLNSGELKVSCIMGVLMMNEAALYGVCF